MEIIKTDKPKKKVNIEKELELIDVGNDHKQSSIWTKVCLQPFSTSLVRGANFMLCECDSAVRTGSKHILGILSLAFNSHVK